MAEPTGFRITLDNFEGPFDLLLSLISKHEMEVTEVALSAVTDEFLAFISAAQGEWDLSEASEFLVVAATLLDLKAARLLPSGEVDDLEDLELLEARDLLFARLLQYKAFKDMSGTLREMLDGPRAVPRNVAMEPHFALLLPELRWSTTPDDLVRLAAKAFSRDDSHEVSLAHLHSPKVSVREQAALVSARLRRSGSLSFRALVADADHLGVVVARFLSLLELFRDRRVSFEQAASLGDLTVRWTGGDDDGDLDVEEFEGGLPVEAADGENVAHD